MPQNGVAMMGGEVGTVRFRHCGARLQRLLVVAVVSWSVLWLAGCGQGAGTGGQTGADQGGASQSGAAQPSGDGEQPPSGADRFDTGPNCPPGFVFVPNDTYILGGFAMAMRADAGFTLECEVIMLTADLRPDDVREYHKARLTAAGLALQAGDDSAVETTFVGDGITLNLTVIGEAEQTQVRYRWTATFPDEPALAAAVAGPATLTAGDEGPNECLPYGALVPREAQDVEIGAFLVACHAQYVLSGAPIDAVAFYQRLLTQPPFELASYSLAFHWIQDAFVPDSAEFHLDAPELGMDSVTITVASDAGPGLVVVEMSWNNTRN